MKNKVIIFLMLFLFALPKITAFAQNRNVYWVHGLGGNETAWEYYANIFTSERKINSIRQNYGPTTDGLAPAAARLRNSVTNTNSTNLAIGHSMGGVMIREVDRMPIANNPNAAKKFGGYITVASPNNGAPVSANLLNGNVAKAAQKAVEDMMAGPTSDPLMILPLIVGGVYVHLFVPFDINLDFLSQTTNNDLKEGSKAMNDINDFTQYTPVPHRISIIAEETSPVHWRMISSMRNGAGTNNEPGDDIFVNKANNIKDFYVTMRHVHMLNPFLGPKWQKNVDWMNRSEHVWGGLIKATKQELVSVWEWVWMPCDPPITPPGGGGLTGPGSIGGPGSDTHGCGVWVYVNSWYFVTQVFKNDGLLPTYAQKLKGIPDGNIYVIDHANHFEIRNMSQSRKNGVKNDGTKNTLNLIFNRNDWFKTDAKTPI